MSDQVPEQASGWPSADEPADDAPSANLVAIVLPDTMLAQEALLASYRLVARTHLKLQDAALVTKDTGGKVRVRETRDVTTAQGAASGGWIGLVGGLLLGGPIGLAVGALGAAAGGIWAKLRDIGIQDEQMQDLGEKLQEGETALLLLVEEAHVFHSMAELRRFSGRLLHTTCDERTVERIEEALAVDPWSTVS